MNRNKKKAEKTKNYKKDLEDLMKQNEDRKLQNYVGISKEEMAINRGLLSSMIVKQSRGTLNDLSVRGLSRVEVGF